MKIIIGLAYEKTFVHDNQFVEYFTGERKSFLKNGKEYSYKENTNWYLLLIGVYILKHKNIKDIKRHILNIPKETSNLYEFTNLNLIADLVGNYHNEKNNN